MRQDNQFRIVLSEIGGNQTEQLRFFALLNLGMVQSLASGLISAAEAIQLFYNAENCLYVREHFRNKEANAIMSHGVQLLDLFECLPAEEASREFFHELETIRSLCMNLLAAWRSTDIISEKVRQSKKFDAEKNWISDASVIREKRATFKAREHRIERKH